MSIETQYYSQATPLFTVPKTEFSPMPDVNGLVVEFAPHLPEDRAVADAEGFLTMVGSHSASAMSGLAAFASVALYFAFAAFAFAAFYFAFAAFAFAAFAYAVCCLLHTPLLGHEWTL